MTDIFTESTRILVVDDQPFNIIAIKIVFDQVRELVHFDECFNGQEAVDKLARSVEEKYKYK